MPLVYQGGNVRCRGQQRRRRRGHERRRRFRRAWPRGNWRPTERRQDDAGLNGPAAHYLDTVAQTSCNPLRMPDGTLRCVPTTIFASASNGIVIGFADSTCTTTASACPVVGQACPGLVVATIEPEANGEVLVKSLHATRPITTFFQRFGTQCMPSTPSVPLFALAAEQTTWDSFPLFTERNARAPDAP